MSTITTRPGHPLVHEAPPRNVERFFITMIVAFGALLVGTILLLMVTI